MLLLKHRQRQMLRPVQPARYDISQTVISEVYCKHTEERTEAARQLGRATPRGSRGVAVYENRLTPVSTYAATVN